LFLYKAGRHARRSKKKKKRIKEKEHPYEDSDKKARPFQGIPRLQESVAAKKINRKLADSVKKKEGALWPKEKGPSGWKEKRLRFKDLLLKAGARIPEGKGRNYLGFPIPETIRGEEIQAQKWGSNTKSGFQDGSIPYKKIWADPEKGRISKENFGNYYFCKRDCEDRGRTITKSSLRGRNSSCRGFGRGRKNSFLWFHIVLGGGDKGAIWGRVYEN